MMYTVTTGTGYAGGRTTAGKRTPWFWVWLGCLLGAVLSVLLFPPARWLASALGQVSHGQLQLQDARGTLWSGSARLALHGDEGGGADVSLPSRVGWELRPGLSGMALELQAACCLTQALGATLTPRWGGWQLRLSDSQSAWPAHLLTGVGTPFNTIAPDGQLEFRTHSLGLTWTEGRLQVAGTAVLDVQNISSRLSTLRPMGSYRFEVIGGATPQLMLSTLQGPLQLSGSGQWVGGRLRFSGQASSAPEHQAALSNLLNIIGRRDGVRSFIQLG
jgi:general secretion pathway protein N